jgi:uncharacterized phage infection (PIP) family protein YhgE
MPNESEGPIQLFDNSVPSINLALAQVLERLDAVKGLRGDPTIYAATTVGAPGQSTQAARLADLPTEDPASVLFWLLQPRPLGPGAAPTSLTDSTGGTANDTLTALGGITPLTDGTGGSANDTLTALGGIVSLTDNTTGAANDTLQALPDPADTPADADALRDDLVTNLIPALRNNYADLAAKVNALIADMDDCKNNFADCAAKINALIADMDDCKNNFADVAAKVNALISEGKVAGVLL